MMKYRKEDNISTGDLFFKTTQRQVYLDFYNLKVSPFSITPDPEFLFLSETHQNVIDKILYGINTRMGFILLTGEVGTGKTTICRSILDDLEDKAETVYIINPSISGEELISSILDDLGIDYPSNSTKKDLLSKLNNFLLEIHDSRPVVIIIDDAQTMPLGALEDLRLFSNLETDKTKLLQMILVGQPELIDMLLRPEMRQLKQRIAINCCLEYLTEEEVGRYIDRRLFVAGDKGNLRFSSKVKKKIADVSMGIPRLINKLCDYCLIAAYISEENVVKSKHLEKALSESGGFDFIESSGSSRTATQKKNRLLTALLLISGLIILTVIAFGNHFFHLSLPDVFISDRYPSTNGDSGLVSNRKNDNLSEHDNIVLDKCHEESTVASTSDSVPMAVVKNAVRSSDSFPDVSSSVYYSLQLGSFKTIDKTVEAVKMYEKYGFEVYWNQVNGKNGLWYKLCTGRFEGYRIAENFKLAHSLDDAVIVPVPWIVLVKEAASFSELEQTRVLLRENKYDVFDLRDNDGLYKIVAGFFDSRGNAQKFASDLAGLGISAQVMLR